MQLIRENSDKLLSMEQLRVNKGNGQSYGYIVYRKRMNLKDGAKIKIRGHVRDLLQLMINGVMVNDPIKKIADLVYFGSWGPKLVHSSSRLCPLQMTFDLFLRDTEFTVDLSKVPGGCDDGCVVDFMVENLGRANFGQPHQFDQKKGLWEGPVIIDGEELTDWEIIPMEFKNKWVQE